MKLLLITLGVCALLAAAVTTWTVLRPWDPVAVGPHLLTLWAAFTLVAFIFLGTPAILLIELGSIDEDDQVNR